ncbi:hypothetical protein MSAN_00304100 [Mycena sanguinolenta]|uniref:Uncharacterized protein n=1 Tax=Mycena sanguinolenta TaxID=230812 RepID=A0A8H7DJ58_9AGAR|nr:hypothetical protein MSAN_00304100 [Mycena sanguinolenta]
MSQAAEAAAAGTAVYTAVMGGHGEGPSVKISSSVTARTVTNFVKNKYSSAPTVRSGFRTIPLGEINLQQEIHSDRHSGVASLRKLHSAKILVEGERLDVTVAVYQGAGAKNEWRRDIAKYRAVRYSPAYPVVQDYFEAIFGRYLHYLDCTFFIRRSTARFCVDLVPGNESVLRYSHGLNETSTQRGLGFLAGENSEATIIDALSLDRYHEISLWEFSTQRYISVAPSATVNIGSVLRCPSDGTFDDVVKIAWLPNADRPLVYGWHDYGDWSSFAEPMADGWTRFESNHIVDTTPRLSVKSGWRNNRFWLSEANHIFTTLQISSDFQNYVLVDDIYFSLSVSTTEAILPSFPFLCPPHHFQTGECTEQLTSEEAISLGFPSIRLSTRIHGWSWDASVYAGFRQFHKAKGFDPDSQDVARHLGHELYQLSGQNRTDTLFAHIEGKYSDNADNEGNLGGHPLNQESNDALNHDLASPFIPQNVAEVPGSSTSEETVVSDHVDLPTTSAHQDAEEMPVSSTFKLVLNAQLTLLFILVLFWVRSDDM